jgi:hypothetical protein
MMAFFDKRRRFLDKQAAEIVGQKWRAANRINLLDGPV